MAAEPGAEADPEAEPVQRAADPAPEASESEQDRVAFRTQSRIFLMVGGFLAVLATTYWFLSYEAAGTTMIALAGGLTLTVGAYIGWNRPALVASPDRPDEPAEDDEPWFPAASAWPFALAVGLVLVANGLLLGLWLMLPAGAFLAFALGGFIRQSRYRS